MVLNCHFLRLTVDSVSLMFNVSMLIEGLCWYSSWSFKLLIVTTLTFKLPFCSSLLVSLWSKIIRRLWINLSHPWKALHLSTRTLSLSQLLHFPFTFFEELVTLLKKKPSWIFGRTVVHWLNPSLICSRRIIDVWVGLFRCRIDSLALVAWLDIFLRS